MKPLNTKKKSTPQYPHANAYRKTDGMALTIPVAWNRTTIRALAPRTPCRVVNWTLRVCITILWLIGITFCETSESGHEMRTFFPTTKANQSTNNGAKATSSTERSKETTIVVNNTTKRSFVESPIRQSNPISIGPSAKPNQLKFAIASSRMLVVMTHPRSVGGLLSTEEVK